MSDIRLVISDVDGTLVAKHSHEVSKSTRAAIEQIQAGGGHVAIATARPPEYARTVVQSLGLNSLQVVDGGASIYDYSNDEYVWQQWLELKKLRQIIQAIDSNFRVIDCFSDFRMLKAEDFDIDMVSEAAPYVYAQIERAAHDIVWQNLSTVENIAYAIVSQDDTYDHVQICHSAGTKRHGVEQLQQILGVSKHTTLAIGDADNDLALFEIADHCVAMGNASGALKAQATYVTDAIEDDGWAKAMQHFGV